MLIQLPIITEHDLEEAHEWGDGWCLACGARNSSLDEGQALQECRDCGEKAVIGAESLELIARRVGE